MKIQLSGLMFWLRVNVFVWLILVVPAVVVAAAVEVEWNTFMGFPYSKGGDIAVDSSGNVYITTININIGGTSGGTRDVVVAKLDSSGNLSWWKEWGTLPTSEHGEGIAVDNSGNVYVTGYGGASWGDPVKPYVGGNDAFVAKFDSSGDLSWNTFLGSSVHDYGYGISVDENGNVYVIGKSKATWGEPVNLHVGEEDVFVAKLDSSGNLSWNTFLGSSSNDIGESIAVDNNGNVYVVGESGATWGSPVDLYAGGVADAFVAKLDSSGSLSWNTFLGSSGGDGGYGIAVDKSGTLYVTGSSEVSWGNPVNDHTGYTDAFVAKLDSSGNLKWNTFMGSSNVGSSTDFGYGIVVGENGKVYVTGSSEATWGNPVNVHAGGSDIFVAQVSGNNGNLDWNTFLGSSSDGSGFDNDSGFGIVAVNHNIVYVMGYSESSWGTPVKSYGGGSSDTFVAKLTIPDPSYLQFSFATFQAAENIGEVVIKVSRTGNSDGAVSVDYASSDDTAVAGSDYIAATGTLTWEAGESGEKSFMVNLIDDGEVEGNESVVLTLSNVSGGGVLGSPSTATLIVVDDDHGEGGCKHAIYSLDDQTLAIPAVEVPILSIIDQQPTGESMMLTSILKQQPLEPTQFSILFLSEVFPEVIAAASVCPASYSLTSGVLSLPWVDIPVVAELGSQQSEVGVEVFRVIMRWRADLERFVVEEIQRVE